MRSHPHRRPASPGLPVARRLSWLLLAITIALAGCQKSKTKSKDVEKTGTGSAAGTGTGTGTAAPAKDLDSKDILARANAAPEVFVKHVLLGWPELAPAYRGRLDPRAAKRSNAETAALAMDIAAKLRANPDQIDALVKEHSEDPGSLSGEPYTVTADAPFVPEFKQLALRLKEKEAGIVKTMFGYHVMVRVPPAALDPIESADILGRPGKTDTMHVQHVLVAWSDVPAARQQPVDPRAAKRTKAEADKLAQELLVKVRAGGDMAALMKEFSEDPGSKDNARTYEVSPAAGLVEPFKKLALRLELGEAGLVKTVFGWHVIKRVPPPPPPPPPAPDKLDSVDILKREPVTEKAKVKHILLGWKEVNADNPRGAGRSRADLEALVKKTMAALKKGAKIEPLMKELSEDPGSAESGTSYDVTPDAGLVPPFKNLSLRLKVGEVGAVKTDFGIHIIQRTE